MAAGRIRPRGRVTIPTQIQQVKTTEATLDSLTPAQRKQLLKEVEDEQNRRRVKRSFREFLPLWQFLDRDTGEKASFETLWEGQEEFLSVIEGHEWIFALKAGKLGFTELSCAYAAWRAVGNQKNARIHVFSRSCEASTENLRHIEYGLLKLPEWIQPTFLKDEAGGKTMSRLSWNVGPDDKRTIVCYAAGPNVSVDQSAHHALVDELARMPQPQRTWSAIYTTIPENGTCHVVTRGKGEDNYAATLWKQAKAGTSRFYPLFQPYTARPGRDHVWYEQQTAELVTQELKHFAPEKEEDALAGDDQNEFIPIEWWDRCKEDMPPLLSVDAKNQYVVDQTPLVVALDAGLTSDHFGVAVVSSHPTIERGVAIRGVREWIPPKGRAIDFKKPKAFIRWLYLGGCPLGHPVDDKKSDCEACESGAVVPAHNIVYVVYDEYQLHSMAQEMRDEGLVAFKKFDQNKLRNIADSQFRDLIVARRVTHDGDPRLREHIANAAAKIDLKEERKLRIIKKSPEKKVDLAVCVSMASYQCLKLLI